MIGLDTFDYNAGARSNLKTGGGFDELRILIDAPRRNTFARTCAKSVGEELQKRVQQFRIPRIILEPDGPMIGEVIVVDTKKIGSMFEPLVPNFEEGLRIGAEELKQYLQDLVRKYAPNPPWANAAPQQGPQPGPQQGPQIGMRPPLAPFPGPQMGLRPPQGPQPGGQGQPPRVKTIPQGILDRMEFLGWNV